MRTPFRFLGSTKRHRLLIIGDGRFLGLGLMAPDLLVAWEPGRSLLDHAGLVEDLQELLGMKVHVGTEKSLHWYVRDRILREATPL